MTPASSATPRTSPFGPPPSMTRLIVSGETATSASATARRAVDRLVADVDHPRPAGPIDVGQAAALAARGLLGHASSVPMVARWVAGRLVRRTLRSARVEPPQLDGRAGRRADRAPRGSTARRVRGGERRDHVTPLPRRPPARRTRTRPASSRTGAPSASRSATTRRKPRRPGLFETSARAGPPRSTGRRRRSGRWPASAPDRRAGRTARTSRSSRPGCRAGRTAASGPPSGALRGPERERLAGLDGDPPELDPADLLERGFDDVVRPDRHAARDDRSRRRRRPARRTAAPGRPRAGPPRSRASCGSRAGVLDERRDARAVRVGDARPGRAS